MFFFLHLNGHSSVCFNSTWTLQALTHPDTCKMGRFMTLTLGNYVGMEDKQCENMIVYKQTIESLLDFAQAYFYCASLKRGICNYGFVLFGDFQMDRKFDIGVFGILKFVSFMFDMYDNKSMHDRYRPIKCQEKRIVRASMAKMATVFQNNCTNIEDNKYWKRMILITLGVYSFYFLNFERFHAINTVAKYSNAHSHAIRYLKKFVISNIESNLATLNFSCENVCSKLSSAILAVSYAFIGNFEKYNKYSSYLFDIVIDIWPKSILSNIFVIVQHAIEIRSIKNGQEKNHYVESIVSIEQHNAKMLRELQTVVETINNHSKHNTRDDVRDTSWVNSDQYRKWVRYVVDKETRNEIMFSKWKKALSCKRCYNCGDCLTTSMTLAFKKCKNCQKAFYCNKECQKQHWLSHHSKMCQKLKSNIF